MTLDTAAGLPLIAERMRGATARRPMMDGAFFGERGAAIGDDPQGRGGGRQDA